MKGKKAVLALILSTTFLFTPSYASASDWKQSDSAGKVSYNVEVSAPDGGVNFRRGPGAEYEQLQEAMIPNGTLLPIFEEATAQNGNSWGLTAYNGTRGWIALTQVRVTSEVAFEEFWQGVSAKEVNYNVEVSAPDGGVNFRWGPGAEYVKLQDDMIPNGTELHVSLEAAAQNGNSWGLAEYDGQYGWIALTQVSKVTIDDPETDKEIVFEHFMENGMEYATVTSYDEEENMLWRYETDSYEMAQCSRVSKIGRQNGYFYMIEDGAIIALHEATGEVAWKNEEFVGAGTEKGYVFDKDGTLYISGYLEPDLFIVDKNGKTLYRKDSFEQGYWPFEMELKDESILRIHFENDQNGNGTDLWMEIPLEELDINKKN